MEQTAVGLDEHEGRLEGVDAQFAVLPIQPGSMICFIVPQDTPMQQFEMFQTALKRKWEDHLSKNPHLATASLLAIKGDVKVVVLEPAPNGPLPCDAHQAATTNKE